MGRLNRRDWLLTTITVAGSATVGSARRSRSEPTEPRTLVAVQSDSSASRFSFGLNTSTIRGHELSVPDQIKVVAEAGYDAIEPWIRDLDRYVESGGSLKSLRAQIEDAGLAVPGAIGFFPWGVDDKAQREEGLAEARRSMELIAAIGGTGIAAPPVGLTDRADVDLLQVADYYADLLELGEAIGVRPMVEVWGFSKTLSRLSEAALVAIASGRSDASILPDVYHLYKGGSDFTGLNYLNGASIPVFHLNDYPAEPPRDSIGDADRVFTGDGVAPLSDLIQTLGQIGFKGTFSLELFNREYWQRPVQDVVREGLTKMKAVVEQALPSR